MEDRRGLEWTERSRELIARSPIFGIWRSRRAAPDGREGEFWILEAADWVNVVAVTRDEAGEDCFLMVRQFRHGANLVTTEFPAGLVEPGEEPRHAAARELAEETGYRAGRLVELGRVRPNPAFMSNWCVTFLAEDLAKDGDPRPDRLERLEPRLVPVREVLRSAGSGEYVNSLVIVALAWYRRREGDRQ